jgi:Ser/Thr protein kinase RdoA (MazF antagonist)
MNDPTAAPYDGLTPEVVLDAVESAGLRCDGRQLALNSYENRVYQVGIESAEANAPTPAPVVAKFYRTARWSDAQILEEHAFTLELAAREIPVVAPLVLESKTLHSYGGFRFAVYPRRGGRAPELEDPETLEWIGRFLGRIHAVGAIEAFQHRPVLDVETFGHEPRAYLLEHNAIPSDLLDAWRSVTDQALDAVAACYERAGAVRNIRLHGDCHAGNILYTGAGPHFVDFDDCRGGPAVQDLWMLLSGDARAMSRQLEDVLAGYEDFCEFDARELHLIEAGAALERSRFSDRISVVRHAALLAGAHPRIARANRAHAGTAARALALTNATRAASATA